LDKAIHTTQLLARAKQHKVGFQPGERFSSRQGLHHYMRLSFAYYDAPALREGVARLKQTLQAYTAGHRF
jgi:DNA-binding transcriptional MocR family regulator